MAQREKEIQMPENLTLCANGCGFHGNPATNNLCQACFQASSGSAPQPSFSGSPERPPRSAPAPSLPRPEDARRGAAEPATTMVNRCAGCGKRVGLTGFRCRCGELFCGAHRYSDRHDCSFDYKAAARASIARENPAVRAAKIVRF